MTGFYRDGCGATEPEDLGSYTVCSIMTPEFLEFSLLAGNDLSTPRPEWGFPGLSPGDLGVSAHLAGSRRTAPASVTAPAATAMCSSSSSDERRRAVARAGTRVRDACNRTGRGSPPRARQRPLHALDGGCGCGALPRELPGRRHCVPNARRLVVARRATVRARGGIKPATWRGSSPTGRTTRSTQPLRKSAGPRQHSFALLVSRRGAVALRRNRDTLPPWRRLVVVETAAARGAGHRDERRPVCER
jgi:uncharacterized protein (DUF2237 family)